MAFGKTRSELGIDLAPLGISMTAEELALEMSHWVAGVPDWHDLVIAEAKRLTLERYEQERQKWTDLAEPYSERCPHPNHHQILCNIYGLLRLTLKPDAGMLAVTDGQVVDGTVASR